MRLALLLLVPAIVLSGCLEDKEVAARLDETRLELDEAQAAVANLTAEGRASRDAFAALSNETNLTRAQRDDALGLLHVSEARLAEAEASLDAARANVTLLEARVAGADVERAENATRSLEIARAELARVQALYAEALEGRFRTLTSIERANVTWQFADLRADEHQWRYPLESYRQDVKRIRPSEHLVFTTKGGNGIRVADPRPYIDGAGFEPYIGDLTNDRSDKDFVREAFHAKSALVTYQYAPLTERGFYKYPGETLVEAAGVCGDTTVLLASLIDAGNTKAGYGIEMAVWIVQYDVLAGQLIQDPETVNHAFLEVKFRDGETWHLETTSYDFRTHAQAFGWRYAIG